MLVGLLSVSVVRVCLFLSLSTLVRVKRLHARESLSDVSRASQLMLSVFVYMYVSLYPKISRTLCSSLGDYHLCLLQSSL